jgi:hypothetical protein
MSTPVLIFAVLLLAVTILTVARRVQTRHLRLSMINGIPLLSIVEAAERLGPLDYVAERTVFQVRNPGAKSGADRLYVKYGDLAILVEPDLRLPTMIAAEHATATYRLVRVSSDKIRILSGKSDIIATYWNF